MSETMGGEGYTQSPLRLNGLQAPERNNEAASFVGENKIAHQRANAIYVAEEAIDSGLVLLDRDPLKLAFNTSVKIIEGLKTGYPTESVVMNLRGQRVRMDAFDQKKFERDTFLVSAQQKTRIVDNLPFNKLVEAFIDVHFNNEILAGRKEQNISRFTNREQEILPYLGFQDPEIAEKLSLSKRTVEAHMKNIRSKLRVETREGVLIEAIRLGLVDIVDLAKAHNFNPLEPYHPLPKREQEVVQFLIDHPNLRSKDYGNRMGIKSKTHHTHISSVAMKLGVTNRSQTIINTLFKNADELDRLIKGEKRVLQETEDYHQMELPPGEIEITYDDPHNPPAPVEQIVELLPSQKENEILSPREIEIMRLVSEGLSNKQIAEIFMVSPRTVSNHLTHVLRKLNAKDRKQASSKYSNLTMQVTEVEG